MIGELSQTQLLSGFAEWSEGLLKLQDRGDIEPVLTVQTSTGIVLMLRVVVKRRHWSI
jgi:hypothetical protein